MHYDNAPAVQCALHLFTVGNLAISYTGMPASPKGTTPTKRVP